MLELRIALRFLRRSLGQSLLIVVGIGVGIAVQVFVGSLITSLQASLLDRTVGSSPHVVFEPIDKGGTLELSPADREAVLATPGVTAVSAQQVLSVLVTSGDSGVPLVVKGGELADLDRIYKLSDKMVAGVARLEGDDLLVGRAFAEANGTAVGDRVELVTPDQQSREGQVAGIFETGVQVVDDQLGFVDREFAARALGRSSGDVGLIEVQLEDPFASAETAAAWRAAFPRVTVTDWQAENEQLLSGLRSQSASSYMIQVFVVIAVALGIASTLAVSAVQKTRQIGILKALGMTDRRTGLVFVAQAGMLGIVGTALGVAIGLGLIAFFDRVTSQSGSAFPIEPEPTFIAVSSAVGVLIALLSATIPYRRTSRLDPIEVIQGG